MIGLRRHGISNSVCTEGGGGVKKFEVARSCMILALIREPIISMIQNRLH